MHHVQRKGQQMELPTDMKDYQASDYDSFRLLVPEHAGIALLILVALICIFEPVL